MRGYRRGLWVVPVMFLLAGCAAVTTDREWTRVTDFTREKLGHEAVWQRSEAEKQKMIERTIDHLEHYIPEVRQKIDWLEAATPKTIH